MCRLNETAAKETKPKPRSKKGEDVVSRVTELMKNEDTWIPLEDRKQYQFLGFAHDATRLLFVAGYSKLPCAPTKPHPDYLWGDIQLSKASTFPKVEFTVAKNGTKFILRRCHCAGVKVNGTNIMIS